MTNALAENPYTFLPFLELLRLKGENARNEA
jgi:hypothetical protein